MTSLVLLIGLVSGVATIVSFLVERAGIRGKWVHAAYGFFIALFAAVLVANHAGHQRKEELLRQEISGLTSVQRQAARLLQSTPRGSDGERRGFMFASLAFLEQHKSEIPDTYDMARRFAISSGVLQNKQESGLDRLYQGWALTDGADAMASLLEGLAGGVTE